MSLCECGCGEFTKVASKTLTSRGWVKGKPLRFINGHNNVHIGKPSSKESRICAVCSQEFVVYPSSKAAHCSNDCGRVTASEILSAPLYHIRWANSGLYLKIKVDPTHPYKDGDGYVMFHRFLMECMLGTYINQDYDVHHKDGNPLNNDMSNLEVLTTSEHMRLHFKERKVWELSPR